MNLLAILKESFILLKKQPKAFIPKLVTTALYSIYTVWAAQLALKVYALTAPNSGADAGALLSEAFFLLAFMIILYFIDLVSYAMYPSIVTAYSQNQPIRLMKALAEALKAWSTILVLGVLILTFSFIVSAIALASEILALELSSSMLSAAGLLLVFLLILVFAVLVFFTLPIAVVEKKGVVASFRESIALGFKHKGDLLKVNALLLLLALGTLALGMVSDFKGLAGFAAIALFIIIRLIQAMMYTYLSVVNPYFYVHVRKTG